MNIFVGNLSFEATEEDLKKLFETTGEVTSAVIVMEKEKKAPKSRGFGFVEMPDGAQALAAITALNDKEFMGRQLIVNPARPKTEAQRESELKKRIFLKAKTKMSLQANQHPREGRQEKEVLARPFISRPGTYKGGRRTRSYVMRTGVIEMEKGTKPWQERQENPMRWRKGPDQSKPWQKRASARKPWEKPEGSAAETRPWKRASTEAKPWKKAMGSSKPWQRGKGERKPWEKPIGISKPWEKTESSSEVKPWKRVSREAKPWKKPTSSSKPWERGTSARREKTGFKGRGKPAKIIVDKRQ
ncbi:MAG: hypothetical protein WC412_09000 [Candidatus Omnitrophota bacterium]|jgi:hypothetical protein